MGTPFGMGATAEARGVFYEGYPTANAPPHGMKQPKHGLGWDTGRISLTDGSDPERPRPPPRYRRPRTPKSLPSLMSNLEPRPVLFRQPFQPVSRRRVVQEHSMESAEPGLSPWWQVTPNLPLGAPPSRRCVLAPPRSAIGGLSPPRMRDARMMMVAQRLTPAFEEEMASIRARLHTAQALRRAPSDGIARLWSGL